MSPKYATRSGLVKQHNMPAGYAWRAASRKSCEKIWQYGFEQFKKVKEDMHRIEVEARDLSVQLKIKCRKHDDAVEKKDEVLKELVRLRKEELKCLEGLIGVEKSMAVTDKDGNDEPSVQVDGQ